MADRAASKTPPTSRIKLLMIPVLAVVMMYVLFAPSEKVPVPTLVARPPQNQAEGGVSAPHPDASTPAITWPTIPLTEVLATNPFELPEALKPYRQPEPVVLPEPVVEVEPVVPPPPPVSREEQAAKAAALAAQLREAVKTHRLTALVRTSRGIGAMVGDHVVMVGDKIDERFRVAAIRPDGVVLEAIDPPVLPSTTK